MLRTLQLFCFLNDRNDSPSLVLGQGSCFHNADRIADRALIFLVVRLETDGTLDDFTVQGMLNVVKHGDNKVVAKKGLEAFDMDD